MKTISSTLMIGCVLAGPAVATPFVLDSDINPVVAAGRIVTNGYDDTTGDFLTDVRHFGYTPDVTGFTQNPGFNAFAGSGLPGGQQLRFDVVRQLVRWDGTGDVSFRPIATGEQVRFTFGATSATVTGTTPSVAGFSLGNIAGNGSVHRHLNAFLENPGDVVADGIYFTALRLLTSGGTVQRSDAVYVAFNRGLAAQDFSRAMGALADPLPGDANFDARVDFDDLLVLAQHYGQADEASWFDGDFNRDRAVDFDDLLALAQQYGMSASPIVTGDWGLALAMVPEPSFLFAFVTPLCLRRRRPTC